MEDRNRNMGAATAAQKESPGREKWPRAGVVLLALFVAAFILAGALLAAGLRLTGRLAERRALALAAMGPVAQVAAPASSAGLTVVEIVAEISPSVVSVEVFANGWNRASANGSGIILNEEGYIVTNAHVVAGDAPIRVTLFDETERLAELVGVDEDTDLAVLKIHKKGLVPACFGDSGVLQVGEQVVAIGNAAGILPGTPSLGIVSGLDRQVPIQAMDGSVIKQSLIQTDAAINPGNSGGALVNMHGQVVGISVSKLQSADIDNIGFAIPVNTAVPSINAILEEAALG